MKKYAALIALVLLIGCTTESADACRLRARIRAWIATRHVQRINVAPIPPIPEPDTGDVGDSPLYAPPLPEADIEISKDAAVQEQRAVRAVTPMQSCPTGQCPNQTYQYQYTPRRGIFGWRR